MDRVLCTLCAFTGSAVTATSVGYSNTGKSYFLCRHHALDGNINLHNIRLLKEGENWHEHERWKRNPT